MYCILCLTFIWEKKVDRNLNIFIDYDFNFFIEKSEKDNVFILEENNKILWRIYNYYSYCILRIKLDH